MSIASGIRSGIRSGIVAGVNPSIGGTVAATLDTSALSPQVVTATTPWAATLTWQTLGTGGNGKTFSFRFDQGTSSVEVRDGERHNGVGWVAAAGFVGVHASGDLGDPLLVSQVESAINASSSLIQVTTADLDPTKEIDAGLMDTETCTGTFSGGL